MLHSRKRWRRGRKTRGRAEQPTRAGNDPHFQDIDKRQAAMHTLLSVPFYAYWLYSIHAFIHRQNNILGNAEHQFTQGQVRRLSNTSLASDC